MFNRKDQKPPRRLASRLTLYIILTLLVLLVVVFLGQRLYYAHQLKKQAAQFEREIDDLASGREEIIASETIKVEKKNLIKAVSEARQLVTREMTYTNADIYEKSQPLFQTGIKIPFTTDKSVFTYKGSFKVGVDLSDLDDDAVTVDDDEKTITVTLPTPVIISHELDTESFQIYDVKKAVFTHSSMSDYVEMQDALKKKEEENLLADEDFWAETKRGAEQSISELLQATGMIDDYTITFDWRE